MSEKVIAITHLSAWFGGFKLHFRRNNKNNIFTIIIGNFLVLKLL